MRLFHVASDEEIKSGTTTDIYFVRTRQVLQAKGLEKTPVFAEVTLGDFPSNWPWGILCGIEEAAHLLEGYPVNVDSMPEGTLFYSRDYRGVRTPVMTIEGPYGEFSVVETPLLGLLCQASGIATRSARIRKVAGEKRLISFGIRRMHPAISPMIDRAAYIGGMDGVSSLSGARAIGKEPVGTMPHALIIAMGDQVSAWKAFDEVISPEVPRVALVDTYFDEKVEAIMAAEALRDRLWGVRLDTPGSRKGNFAEIVREVRWELNVRGFAHVKIMVSGGLDEQSVRELSEAGADGFGVGTSISNAPTIDFALDITERAGKPAAKRGKLGGRKQVWRCPDCAVDVIESVQVLEVSCPKCGGHANPLLRPLIRNGEIVAELRGVDEIRQYVLRQLEKVGV